MVDLTARIERYGDSHMTHIDLYYSGAEASPGTLITECVLLDISGSPETVDLRALPALALVREGDSVILRTGWEAHRGTPKYSDCPGLTRG